MKIDYTQAKKLIEDEGAQFVDVRTPEEFKELGIDGSINLPVQQLAELHGVLLDADRDRPIVLFCRSGNRSNTALQVLSNLGYSRLYDMGSYLDWKG